jgi:hypothetical protein
MFVGWMNLTPKGPNVRRVDKPLWVVSLELILFLDFKKHFMYKRPGISFVRVQI